MPDNSDFKSKTISESLNRVSEWVRFADTKAATIGTLLAILIAQTKDLYLSWWLIMEKLWNSNQNTNEMALSVTLAIYCMAFFTTYTLLLILKTLKPNISNKNKSPLFYGTIASKSLGSFNRDVKKMSNESLLEAITEQLHTNSRIASTKHAIVNQAIIGFAITVLASLVAYIVINLAEVAVK